MIRQAYCTLDALETVDAFKCDPHFDVLHQVLEKYHHIVVHLSDDEFFQQLKANACLKFYAKRTLRVTDYDVSSTADSYQMLVSTTPSAELAGTVFVVDDTPAICAQWSRDYGVCIISQQAPNAACYLAQELARKQVKTSVEYQTAVTGEGTRKGWNSVLTPRLANWQAVPLNALVIVDNYLLGDKGDKLALGKENLISLLAAILPANLQVDFHLLLVTTNEQAFLNAKKLSRLTSEVEAALARPYKLKIGVITRPNGPEEHRRAIISNYFFGTSEHGFACFKGHVPQWATDLVVSGLFSQIAVPGYDIPWVSVHDELKIVRLRRDDNLKRRNPSTGYDAPTYLLYGFCDNRLLDLV